MDQMLAAKAFPNESAVGKRILIRIRTPEPEWVEIIGVVAHQRVASLADPGREQVYFADGFTGGNANKWAMRVSGDPGSYGSAGAGRHCAGRSAVSHHRAAADGRPGRAGRRPVPVSP